MSESTASVHDTACSCSPAPALPASFLTSNTTDAVATPAQPPTTATEEEEEEEEEEDDDAVSAAAAAKWAALLKTNSDGVSFEYQKHVQFFAMHLKSIPTGYQSLDTSRMTLLYFCLSALDVLGALDETVLSKEGRAAGMIEWIYAQQVHPYTDPTTGVVSYETCGFRGGTSSGVPFEPNRTTGHAPTLYRYDEAHIAMTYTALCCLRILGDTTFSRVNRKAVIGALKSLQQADGSFSSTRHKSECDMRFLYCACAISAMLNDWSGFDIERSVNFIASSQSYDGGIGLWPGCEGHGGSTYCAVASLVLMRRFTSLPSTSSLLKWVIMNQGSGYRGRPNKPSDTCYSFWLGASLEMIYKELGISEDEQQGWTCDQANREFNLICQSKYGGFSKIPGPFYPDLLHSYMALCGLKLIGVEKQLKKLDCMLGLTMRAAGDSNRKLDGTW